MAGPRVPDTHPVSPALPGRAGAAPAPGTMPRWPVLGHFNGRRSAHGHPVPPSGAGLPAGRGAPRSVLCSQSPADRGCWDPWGDRMPGFLAGRDLGFSGGTGTGCWDPWWERDRTLGSRRDSFFMPGTLSCCHPAVSSGASPGSGGWQRRSRGGGGGVAAAAVRSELGDSRGPRGGAGRAEPGGSEEHADPPGSRLALPPAGGTDGGTAGGHEDVPDIILVPGRAFHVGHGADLPGHGLSLRGHAESEPAGDSGCRAAPSRPAGR